MRQRSLYYWAKLYEGQLHEHEAYNTLRPTVAINPLRSSAKLNGEKWDNGVGLRYSADPIGAPKKIPKTSMQGCMAKPGRVRPVWRETLRTTRSDWLHRFRDEGDRRVPIPSDLPEVAGNVTLPLKI